MLIEKLLYNLFAKRTPCDLVITKLHHCLWQNGYKVRSLAYINFFTFTARHPTAQQRSGYIKLKARKGNHTLAIEFDPGLVVRFKSAEKLIQSGCSIKIAIVRGNLRNRSVLRTNLDRLKTTITRLPSNLKGELWLVILSERLIYKLFLTDFK